VILKKLIIEAKNYVIQKYVSFFFSYVRFACKRKNSQKSIAPHRQIYATHFPRYISRVDLNPVHVWSECPCKRLCFKIEFPKKEFSRLRARWIVNPEKAKLWNVAASHACTRNVRILRNNHNARQWVFLPRWLNQGHPYKSSEEICT